MGERRGGGVFARALAIESVRAVGGPKRKTRLRRRRIGGDFKGAKREDRVLNAGDRGGEKTEPRTGVQLNLYDRENGGKDARGVGESVKSGLRALSAGLQMTRG